MPDPEPRTQDRPRPERRVGVRRAEVLRAVRAAPAGTGVAALVEATGLHENTVRFHLSRLVEEGMVERRAAPAGVPGRPPITFVSRPAAAPGGSYQVIAEVLSRGLPRAVEDPAEVARQIGLEWGRSLHDRRPPAQDLEQAVEDLGGILDRFGFDPEVQHGADGAEVRIRTCPFIEVTREHQTVPCGVHLGMMQGILQEAGTEAEVELEPFAQAPLCLGRVTRR